MRRSRPAGPIGDGGDDVTRSSPARATSGSRTVVIHSDERTPAAVLRALREGRFTRSTRARTRRRSSCGAASRGRELVVEIGEPPRHPLLFGARGTSAGRNAAGTWGATGSRRRSVRPCRGDRARRVMYLNPVIRWDGVALPAPHAELKPVPTWTVRALARSCSLLRALQPPLARGARGTAGSRSPAPAPRALRLRKAREHRIARDPMRSPAPPKSASGSCDRLRRRVLVRALRIEADARAVAQAEQDDGSVRRHERRPLRGERRNGARSARPPAAARPETGSCRCRKPIASAANVRSSRSARNATNAAAVPSAEASAASSGAARARTAGRGRAACPPARRGAAGAVRARSGASAEREPRPARPIATRRAMPRTRDRAPVRSRRDRRRRALRPERGREVVRELRRRDRENTKTSPESRRTAQEARALARARRSARASANGMKGLHGSIPTSSTGT